MEGNKTYEEAYDYMNKLVKENLTGKVTIDYSKLDERSASLIRLALSRAIGQRKRELWSVVSKPK